MNFELSLSLGMERFCAISLLVIGIVLRFASLGWNVYPHGDVLQYSVAAESLARRGDFLIDANVNQTHFYSLQEKGGRFLEHNPLWPFLGAGAVWLIGLSGYQSLQLLSFASGIFLLILSYALGMRIGGPRLALITMFFATFSYLLIDFSANGSFYVFQGVLYIIFLLLINRINMPYRRVLMGLIFGLAVILNQQNIVLILAYAVYAYISRRSMRAAFGEILFCVAVAAFVGLPWWLRNYFLFGAPFYSIDMTYVWDKLGVGQIIQGNVISYRLTIGTYIDLLKRSFSSWLPHNLYFINRKLFILAPLTYIFSLLFLIEAFFKERFKKFSGTLFFPMIVLAGFYLLISAVWPIAKFRYLVPLLPFVFLMGGYYIIQFIDSRKWRNVSIATSMVLLILFSGMTFFSTPSHTYYYDGSITADNFGKNGETDFILEQQKAVVPLD